MSAVEKYLAAKAAIEKNRATIAEFEATNKKIKEEDIAPACAEFAKMKGEGIRFVEHAGKQYEVHSSGLIPIEVHKV